MIFLYDVWVNWFEGEEDGFNVCHYHEWRKSDQIEILEQVPVLYITESLFDYIENSLHDLPDSLLDMIHKRAYIRQQSLQMEEEFYFLIRLDIKFQ